LLNYYSILIKLLSSFWGYMGCKMPIFKLSLSPTDRDLQILYFIYLLNGCSIDHLAARFFSGSLKAAYARVAKLMTAGLVGTQRPGSSSGVGSGKALLTLPDKGRAVLAAEYLRSPISAVRPVKQVSTAYARDHHLALCDFWLSLELAIEEGARSHQSLYLEWTAEKELRADPIQVTQARRPAPKIRRFIPDGDFTIWLSSNNKQTFKLEMESDPLRRPAIIKDKLAGYFDYISSDTKDCATSGTEPEPVVPFSLWVVPDTKAQLVMTAWILELAHRFGDDPSYFWITTRSAIASSSILTPVWKAAGVERPQGLIPAAYLEAAPPALEPLPPPSLPPAYDV
jgi:hypothetical protein